MLKNEKFYEKSDIEDMLPEAEVTEPGKYWAIGDNGRAYSATYFCSTWTQCEFFFDKYAWKEKRG